MKKLSLILMMLGTMSMAWCQQTYVYTHRDTAQLKLDVYQPAHPRADKACVLYVFGGGFVNGARNDKDSQRACTLLAERGFVAVAMDYRLYMSNPPKTPLLKLYTLFDTAIRYAVEDCSDAVSYLCSHAAELNIDPTHIILTGSSAGAVTVLQTDYSRVNHLACAAALPTNFKPAAVVAYSGAIFCRNRDMKYNSEPAPTCMFHGTCDKIVNYDRFHGSLHYTLFGAKSIAKVFSKNHYNYWVMRFLDRGHEIASVLPYTIDEYCAFVDAALAGRVMQYDATCTDSAIKQNDWTHKTIFQLYLK